MAGSPGGRASSFSRLSGVGSPRCPDLAGRAIAVHGRGHARRPRAVRLGGLRRAIAGPNALSVCSAGNYQNEQLCWFTPDFSPLWQPVRQFPHLTASTTIVALYCGAVFCYLAAPLVIGLLRSVHLKRSWAEAGGSEMNRFPPGGGPCVTWTPGGLPGGLGSWCPGAGGSQRRRSLW